MKKFIYTVISLATLLGLFIMFGGPSLWKDPPKEPVRRTSGAMEALNFWTRSRAYPNADIPPDAYYRAFETSKARFNEAPSGIVADSAWRPIGPLNVGGRMISVAINPLNPNTVLVGGASGGVWRSYTGGLGADWHRIETGYPVLGVMAIAINPVDTNVVYIGTGEVYGYHKSIGGTVVRTTRGSYGIGILKSTNAGATWQKSLDWSYNQERGVQAIRLNPYNPNTIFAATTEGIYKSVNAGASWNLMLNVLMGEDIVIHTGDTNMVLASCGNLGSVGSGVYQSTDGGASWVRLLGIPSFSGKTLLEMFAADPDIVYASVADSLSGRGLWRSTNFGSSWVQLHNVDVPRYQGFFAHWVAVHPTDNSRLIHAGVSIYLSTDGGSTVNAVGGIHVDHHNYAHHPTNPEILYVVNDGGVYRTVNFGASYQNLELNLQTTQFYNGFSNSATDSLLAMGGLQDNNTVIYRGNPSAWSQVIGGDGCWTAIDQNNDNIMYGESQYNNIRKSTNRGASFFNATSGLFGSAAFVAPFINSPSHPNVLYSGRQRIFKSGNSANSWFATNNSVPLDANFALSMAMSHQGPDTVYVGTAPLSERAHIFRTTNGGVIWSNVTGLLPDRYPMDIAVDPQDAANVYIAFSGFGTGHIFRSTDAGITWMDVTGSLPDVPTSSVVVDPTYSDHVYIGNDIGVYVSTDAGTTWSAFQSGMPDAVIAMDLSISPSNRAVRAATHGNGVYERRLLDKMPTGVSKTRDVVSRFKLEQNYPNPFNPTTEIRYSIPASSFVTLKVYDMLGREIATLVNQEQVAGNYAVSFDVGKFSSGVYLYRIQAGDFAGVKKMTILK